MFCPKCGKEIIEERFICEECGKVIKRPKSINIAAIMELVIGILSVLLGSLCMLAIIFSKDIVKPPKTIDGAFMVKYGLLLKYGLLFSNGLLIWGIISFMVWFGLRRLKRWAGVLGITECIVSIILAIPIAFLRDMPNIIINILIIALISTGWRSLR